MDPVFRSFSAKDFPEEWVNNNSDSRQVVQMHENLDSVSSSQSAFGPSTRDECFFGFNDEENDSAGSEGKQPVPEFEWRRTEGQVHKGRINEHQLQAEQSADSDPDRFVGEQFADPETGLPEEATVE